MGDTTIDDFLVEDEALIDHFIAGRMASFDELVKRYKTRIFEFVYFQINHLQDAEDLTQEVFIQLYQKVHEFRRDSKFSSYIYSIAKHLVLNYFRTKSRRIKQVNGLPIDELVEKEYQLSQHTNDTNLALDATASLHNKRKVLAITISKLKVDERQLIYLADRENFTYEQISHILQINIGTVRSRLNALRTKLIALLKDKENEL